MHGQIITFNKYSDLFSKYFQTFYLFVEVIETTNLEVANILQNVLQNKKQQFS